MEKRRGIRLVRTAGTFALGAAIGSAVALLCAPAAGRVTRRRIGQQLRTLKRQTTRQLGQRIKYAQAWVNEHVPNHNGKRRHAVLHHA